VARRRINSGLFAIAPDNASYLEELHERWREDPDSVSPEWQHYFRGQELDRGSSLPAGEARAQSNVSSWMYAIRSQGHLIATTDPVGQNRDTHPALELSSFGLSEADLDRDFDTGHLSGPQRATLRDITTRLKNTYCRSIGVEYMHVQDRSIRRWLQAEMEPIENRPAFDRPRKVRILQQLIDAEVFESFTHTRYLGQKRFSLEGAETLIPAINALIDLSPEVGVKEIVLGMAHRGRLNVLANVIGMSYTNIFTEFEGNFLPNSVQGDGDVKYHKGYSAERITATGHRVHLSLTSNPSHLEAVDPVVEGRVRAKQRQHGDTEQRIAVLPLLIHGDAAFSGQGVVAETLNLSQLKGYHTGGTVHLIINNQIGFTTLPTESRSTVYCTDVVKMIEAPIFHVNGDDPEAMVFATELALRFRQQFHRAVGVDLVGYRKHGHNEGDDPAFTQPVLYAKIRSLPPVRAQYTQRLIETGDLSETEAKELTEQFRQRLEKDQDLARTENPFLEVQAFQSLWHGLDEQFSHEPVETRAAESLVREVARAICTVPPALTISPKVERLFQRKLAELEADQGIDWAFAELLALGTLLCEGTPVRLSGQDSGRGTFSQRHAVWQDTPTQEPYVPLNHIRRQQARFCCYNSTLSEAAVLGFEYGYSLAEPNMLLLWEAQFGDFANGAQVIVDQFIMGAESKWQRDSGLVLLLPHGYEGQGPEHSNAYLERYLAGCAENNVTVCFPTTPAQHFHLLRRQVKRRFRMPLIVMAPKSMLRHKRVLSKVAELANGHFEELLDDPTPPLKARRLVLCSGKVFYDLLEQREQSGVGDVALVRLEQLYPLQKDTLRAVLARYAAAEEVVWVQEESQNRGAWSFVLPQLLDLCRDRPLGYVGRGASASPASGSLKVHLREQAALVQEALQGSIVKESNSDENGDQSTGGGGVHHRGYIARVV
jgi:2-oxoglutarate dehydrogenase E1 component